MSHLHDFLHTQNIVIISLSPARFCFHPCSFVSCLMGLSVEWKQRALGLDQEKKPLGFGMDLDNEAYIEVFLNKINNMKIIN